MAEPFEMRVELGKVREFARATNSRHPDHQSDDGVSPVTFLQSSAFWQTRANDPLPERDLRRSLHAEQEFVFPGGPPPVGARLTGRSRVDDTWTKAGRRGGELTFTRVATDYTDESGALVAQVFFTTVETSKATGAS